MKICHLTTVDSTLVFQLGEQINLLHERGFEVIGIAAPGEYGDDIETLPLQFVPIKTLTRRWSLRQDLRTASELWRLLSGLDLDVLHCHTPKAGVLGRVVGRLRRVPIVANTCHGLIATDHDSFLKRFFVVSIESVASLFSHVELFQNPEDMKKLRFATGKRATYLGNGIDLTRFSFNPEGRKRVRDELGLGEKDLLVGGVGRRVAEKGIIEFAGAARSLSNWASFIWVGPTDSEKSDVVAVDLPGLTFLGERRDMPDVYSALDIFVLPSHREGFPRSAMEAAACGRPLILTDIRGCRQISDSGTDVILVPPSDEPALTAAIKDLLDSPSRRQELGTNIETKAKAEFDVTRVVEVTLSAYEVAQSRKRRK